MSKQCNKNTASKEVWNVTINELITKEIVPVIVVLIKRIEELEEKQKKLEKRVNRYYFIDLFVSLLIVIIICSAK